ncbi:MAG: CHAD domain-containing protein [Stigonema ocellatum SAG 48.90 = DSM 106950]|nr:CHAD domain-containing protein [Stigonema ocellatum SAG 48.90 = DSM 106950]
MTFKVKQKDQTLGSYAYLAMQKHFKSAFKWEKEVKKDKDPEALHQMRVGLRRLRTAVSRFDQAVDLPKSVSDKNIGKIARCLGNLRDMDVLKETIENLYQPHLPHKEQEVLQTALNALDKQRENVLEDVRSTLKDERYKSVKQQLREWLKEPSYQSLASLPIQEVCADLLLPEVSGFLLHPGWLVGTQAEGSEIVILKDWKVEKVEHQLAKSGEVLHSLRKQAKGLRYQMEVFSNLYDESYTAYVRQVKNIQEILGGMQDSVVLAEQLMDVLKSEIHTQLPTLATLLRENLYQLWQQWRKVQQQYLKAEIRHGFHLTILRPI